MSEAETLHVEPVFSTLKTGDGDEWMARMGSDGRVYVMGSDVGWIMKSTDAALDEWVLDDLEREWIQLVAKRATGASR